MIVHDTRTLILDSDFKRELDKRLETDPAHPGCLFLVSPHRPITCRVVGGGRVAVNPPRALFAFEGRGELGPGDRLAHNTCNNTGSDGTRTCCAPDHLVKVSATDFVALSVSRGRIAASAAARASVRRRTV